MNFRYFKGKHLTLKPYLVLAMLIVTVQVVKAQDYGNIEFVENKGQWDSRVKYRGLVDAGAVFIRPQGFTILQHNKQDLEQLDDLHHPHSADAFAKIKAGGPITVRSHSWNVDFIGASPKMEVVPDKVISTYNNYFYGNDQSKWASHCRIFQAVTLKNVYPNIDVRYYTNNGTLKYDILVKPGGKVNNIALRYEGLDKIQVKSKQLVLSTTLGEMKESSPYTFQGAGKERKEINCKYVVTGNIVRFDVKEYDPNTTLIIDPTLVFCSFSGSTNDNWGFTATYGPDGSMYGGGIARNGSGFPVSPGAFQTTWGGGTGGSDAGPNDIGIIKLTPDGSNRVYATYLGGTGNEQPHSLIVDPQGNLIVAGRTNSPNYPTTGTGLIGPGGAHDIVVTKLNATGTALIGSKKIGGTGEDGVNINPTRGGRTSLQRNYGDDGRSEVIIDGGGNIYVASSTQSGDFPVTGGVLQGTFGGGLQDGVVLKFNPTVSALLFGTYLGGASSDAAYVLSIGAGGDIFVAGGTESNAATFPGNHAGTIGTVNNGGVDGYVAQITNNGAAIIRSTFIGTGNYDQIYGIQFDRNGFPYIMGQTEGNMPAINATFSNPNTKQFIAKLQPDLSAYVYRTTFGAGVNNPNISPIAFLVDRCENVYVSGWGGCIGCTPSVPEPYPNAGTSGLPVTADALDGTTDGNDLYFFVLARDATAQLYGSFFGQNGGFTDHVDGGTSRFDANGVIYQAICANCSGGAVFPTTAGAWASVKPASALCNLAMVKMSFNLAGVGSEIQSEIGGVIMDTAGCVPLDVTFTDLVQNAQSYIWNFGDSPDTPELPAATGYTQTHTYTAVGTYQVMLVAIDPTSCNLRDTSYLTIRVGDLEANVDFTATKLGCASLDYRFDNISVAPPVRPFTDTSFLWTFSDAPNNPIIAGTNSITHTFPAPGTYTVILTLRDTAYCNYMDSDTMLLSVAENVDASFTTPDRGCVPYTIELDNTSVAGDTWEWDFGGLGTSTDFEPTFTFNTPGTYTIRLIARNPNTCNLVDTAYRTVTVYPIPTAAFVVNPLVPVENTPHTFTNQSSPDATSFKWIWGDGDSLVTTSRAPVQHQFNATDTFTVCLVAFNDAGCSDTVCTGVRTLITPVVDVPNAFTPNSGDINSRVMVRGFGIAKMRFIIWNRWGQKVFETGNRFEGWDGRVKGQVQPMDVYAFTLDVEFFDGTKATRKGDITLIR